MHRLCQHDRSLSWKSTSHPTRACAVQGCTTFPENKYHSIAVANPATPNVTLKATVSASWRGKQQHEEHNGTKEQITKAAVNRAHTTAVRSVCQSHALLTVQDLLACYSSELSDS